MVGQGHRATAGLAERMDDFAVRVRDATEDELAQLLDLMPDDFEIELPDGTKLTKEDMVD